MSFESLYGRIRILYGAVRENPIIRAIILFAGVLILMTALAAIESLLNLIIPLLP